MKIKILGIYLLILLMASCASIPKETVTLSKTIGSELQILHDSHRGMVQLYYSTIKVNISTFINDVYAPFVIHHVLESELDKHKKGEVSLYGIIESAGKIGRKEETEEVLNIMLEFQEAANEQITTKRNELLSPIDNQEKEILREIDQFYQNTIYANATLTAYLISAHKVKESQNEALSIIGLNGMDNVVTDRLIELSALVDTALEKGKKLDVRSEEAQQEIEHIANTIKKLTNKITK